MAVTVAARDEGLPLPSCVALISPFADLTLSGASMELRKDADPYVTYTQIRRTRYDAIESTFRRS